MRMISCWVAAPSRRCSEHIAMADIDMNDRYSRQMLFAPLGQRGQERLRKSFVVIMGCGAVGSGIAQNLGRAGVGRLRIVDRDRLEMSNLARQVLFEEEDARQRLPKAEAAARRMRAINSEISVEPVVADVGVANVLDLVQDADLILDGSDNMDLRFLLNDACVKTGTPWIYGGAIASECMSMTLLPGRGPCLRCVLEKLPPAGAVKKCVETGVLNTVVAAVSAIESSEAIKLLAGVGDPNPDLIHFDIWTLRFRRSRIARRPDCPACVQGRFEYLDAPQ